MGVTAGSVQAPGAHGRARQAEPGQLRTFATADARPWAGLLRANT